MNKSLPVRLEAEEDPITYLEGAVLSVIIGLRAYMLLRLGKVITNKEQHAMALC